jgi:hypothetical protein
VTSVKVDRAVKRIKALPKNRNCSASKEPLVCGVCRYAAESIADAFVHSMNHGPWPASDDGSLAFTVPAEVAAVTLLVSPTHIRRIM